MHHFVIDFIPPMVGLEGEFNTIRLGMAWSKRLTVGETVYIMDNKLRKVIGTAIVEGIHVDTLENICQHHSHQNHCLLSASNLEREDLPSKMLQIITRIYGPHIAVPSKKATAIYLRRLT